MSLTLFPLPFIWSWILAITRTANHVVVIPYLSEVDETMVKPLPDNSGRNREFGLRTVGVKLGRCLWLVLFICAEEFDYVNGMCYFILFIVYLHPALQRECYLTV